MKRFGKGISALICLLAVLTLTPRQVDAQVTAHLSSYSYRFGTNGAPDLVAMSGTVTWNFGPYNYSVPQSFEVHNWIRVHLDYYNGTSWTYASDATVDARSMDRRSTSDYNCPLTGTDGLTTPTVSVTIGNIINDSNNAPPYAVDEYGRDVYPWNNVVYHYYYDLDGDYTVGNTSNGTSTTHIVQSGSSNSPSNTYTRPTGGGGYGD